MRYLKENARTLYLALPRELMQDLLLVTNMYLFIQKS